MSRLPLFLAMRIFRDNDGRTKVSRPAMSIATLGVAIGLAVMILTVSVVMGFKHTIRDKVAGIASHIQVENFLSLQSTDPYPICIDDSMLRVLADIPHVAHVQRFAYTQGILKTDADFLGITFKGVAQEYDFTFLEQCLVDGQIPTYSDSISNYQLLVSQNTADKLRLAVGDRVHAYFVSHGEVRARRFTVAAIFRTNMSYFDESLCITDLHATTRLNGWLPGQCTGAELMATNFDRMAVAERGVVERVNRTQDTYGDIFTSRTISEAYPQVFSWLDLLDINVWIILVLMVLVAGFTMISGLLITILERTQMIGTLKALGATNSIIRHTFLWFSAMVIGRGLIVGNVLGIGIALLQQYTGFISLNPDTYYVSSAPMELSLSAIVALNVATLAACVAVLVGPSHIVASINPVKAMRYE